MPPPVSRPSICGLQAALSSYRISTRATTPARARSSPSSSPWRAFSATPLAAKPATVVPPESPRFITVPEPPQSSEIKLPPIKGHLPVPRDVFPAREGNRKVTPAYIAGATQMSKAEQAGEPPRSEAQARHRLMAAARRRAFASGIQGLYVRKTQRVQRARARAEAKMRANREAATAPERADDVLTRPTVRAATAAVTAVVPDPDRFAAAEAARARHQEQMELKAEARRDALAQLYVAAKDFIIDEAELEAHVNRVFTRDHHRYGALAGGESVWDAHGAPVSVANLRAEMTGIAATAIDAKRTAAVKTARRQKLVSEELTGGKL